MSTMQRQDGSQASQEPPAKRARATGPTSGASAHNPSASRGGMLTVTEIEADKLTKLAAANWSTSLSAGTGKETSAPAFKPELVVQIYNEELGGSGDDAPHHKRVMLLEISQYLENYLWPNFNEETSSAEHVMSILLMVNEKFRENIPAWTCFHTQEAAFAGLFKRILKVREERELKTHETTSYIIFMIHAFQSLEDESVRTQVLRLVSLPLWHGLGRGRLQLELHAHPQLAKHWKHLAKKEGKAAGKSGHIAVQQRPEGRFISSLLEHFLDTLDRAVQGEDQQVGPLEKRSLLLCERFVELLVDLLSQLPTRRFVRTLLDDRAILVKCRLSRLYQHPGASLFRQLVDMFQFYMTFPMDDHTGEPMGEDVTIAGHYEKLTQLQRLLFKHWPQLKEMALTNCATLEKREVLKKHLAALSEGELRLLVTGQLRLAAENDSWLQHPSFLQEVLLAAYERRRFQREVINAMPLYPTETILWDENQIPSANYSGDSALALPKLNLQFLTAHDYLLRNFNLFRLEATYEIREDIADCLTRVGAYKDDDDSVKFAGWARMASPIKQFRIIEVRKPNVGELKPAAVTAEVNIDISKMRGDVAGEWDALKQHDVMFLITVRPPDGITAAEMAEGGEVSVAKKHGLVYVRGCEIVEMKDEEGKLMNDFTGKVKPEERGPPSGTMRTLVVGLDTAQYQIDLNTMEQHKSEDVYGTFNLLLRRKPKENNFKAVLESIRDIMNEDIIIPEWLHDIFLGYGDPGAAQWFNLPPDNHLTSIDFKDTFLDANHVVQSFPQYHVQFPPSPNNTTPAPPFRITFPPVTPEDATSAAATLAAKSAADDAKPPPQQNGGSTNGNTTEHSDPSATDGPAAPLSDENPSNKPVLKVEPYVPPNPGPYPQNQPRRNGVRFTPVQVDAIRSGVQPGLTMVVGPPGTGKTDTAVQVLNVLYNNCPGQRTLIITHSNQALNDLFQKCMERDIPARYMLRLGMGEAELNTDLDFSRVGRVNAMLSRRLVLLAEVEKMARQFGVTEDLAYTCENAAHFWLLHVLSRWEKFSAQTSQLKTKECVKELFPFKEYFADAPQPLFKEQSFAEDLEIARGCFRHLRVMFQELEECRAFELLKGQADRVSYLVTKQAKIVAMTCTHAALKRREFLQMGLKYDNLLMEEAAQVLEVETFIPMVLQRAEDGVARLKRVVLIGDHQQLPPVVKNMAFQKYSHLDQSLFTRFIRLGTPYIQLNAQGRARPSLAKLYNWRYRELGDLPAVLEQPEYQRANPGFAFDYQFVDVPDLNGVGESEPVPHFFQNLAEAEYLVSTYQFMRLMGYPAERISVLTTYNGQKALLRDVFERRCARHPLFGMPFKVTTVDKYQGQQNDFILLSLVRTRIVGHLRDVRRLVVAMSRGRLGLYIFGRKELFANCYELQPTFIQLLQRPTQLALVKGEDFEHCSRKVSDKVDFDLISGLQEMAGLAAQVTRERMARGS